MKCFFFKSGAKKREDVVNKCVQSTLHRSITVEQASIGTDSDSDDYHPSISSHCVRLPSPPPPLPPTNFPQMPPKSRVFTFAELKSATSDFSRSLIIGEGGFGCVFRGRIKNSEDSHIMNDVAVKQLNKRGLQGHRQWITEVNFLGIANHPNLVKLVGYCAEDDERGAERLLVYEFMPNKSVLDHLSPQSNKPLSWPMRLKIALGSACGLTYLHEEMGFQIIFRDFKTSNILLDEQWNAKLSDFGLAREGPTEDKSHVSTAVVGTLGYAAPEYMRTGHLTAKSDIWSYGIVLYELITGRQPFDPNRPKGEQKLLEWVRPCISNIKKFPRILDPRLAGDSQFSMKFALQLAAVANRCLVRDPKCRPKMSEVLQMVKNIVEATEVGSPFKSSVAATEEAFDRRRRKRRSWTPSCLHID